MADYRLPGLSVGCWFAPEYAPRLFPEACLPLMPQAQDSDDVERRIETIEGKISSGSPRDDELMNVVVHP
jgi:hypothetical protein